MIFKTILLICIGFCVASPVSSNLDDLKELMNKIDIHIRSEVSNAAFVLRPLPVALSYYTTEAHRTYISNLTTSAQPYWTFISVAEREAAQQGQNIDACLEHGHSQIYVVNDTFANEALCNINAELSIGHKLIDDTYGPARNEPSEKLQEMHVKVNACNNETCAVQLQDELRKEYDEISTRIAASLSRVEHYVYVEFNENIEEHIFDPEKYFEEMYRVIADVENCIRQN